MLSGWDIDIVTEEDEAARWQEMMKKRQTHILATTTDCLFQLFFRHDDLNAVGFLVDHDLGDLGRGQRIDDEAGSVLGPWNDVDFLALQFADNGLNPAAAHTDAGTDRIDRAVIGERRKYRKSMTA